MSETGTAAKKSSAKKQKGNIVEIEFIDQKFGQPQFFSVYSKPDGTEVRYKNKNNREASIIVEPPGRTFDLNNPLDAREWDWLKDYPMEQLRPGVLKIRDVALEAANFVKQSKQVIALQGKLCEMKQDELNKFSRLFGINPDLNGDDMVLQKMIQKTNDPDDFKLIVDMMDSGMRIYLEAIKDGIAKNIITESKGIYKYEEFILGHSENQAAETLKANSDLFDTINKQSSKK